MRIEKLKKKIHGRGKILGCSKKLHGLVDSKNVHVLYVWWSLSTAIHHLRKKN
jgi:hypothetical protein